MSIAIYETRKNISRLVNRNHISKTNCLKNIQDSFLIYNIRAKVSDPVYLRELMLFGNKVGGVEAHKMGTLSPSYFSSL